MSKVLGAHSSTRHTTGGSNERHTLFFNPRLNMGASERDRLKDLKMTSDEVSRFTKAFDVSW